MPTIILCKCANPVPGGAQNSFTAQTYNIAKNTRNLRSGSMHIPHGLPEWLTLWWFSTDIPTKTTFGM